MRDGHSRADVTCAMEREGKREMAEMREGGERGVRFSYCACARLVGELSEG